MKLRLIILTYFIIAYGELFSQQTYTGSNNCLIRISTDMGNYKFGASNMFARFNDSMDMLEFIIPVNSIRSLGDSSDMKFLKRFTNGNEDIVIHGQLPGEKDSGLDLSYFNANRSINIPGEIKIGKFNFESNIDFKAIFLEGNHKIAFDFKIFLNEQASPADKVDSEQIIEINMVAQGDKIIELLAY